MGSKEVLSRSMRENRIIPITVRGDEMEPKYLNGDIVLVDTQYKNPSGGGVFCIDNLGTNIARVDHKGKGIHIMLTNNHYGDYTMECDQFNHDVIGRVVGHIQSNLITETTATQINTQKEIAQ